MRKPRVFVTRSRHLWELVVFFRSTLWDLGSSTWIRSRHPCRRWWLWRTFSFVTHGPWCKAHASTLPRQWRHQTKEVRALRQKRKIVFKVGKLWKKGTSSSTARLRVVVICATAHSLGIKNNTCVQDTLVARHLLCTVRIEGNINLKQWVFHQRHNSTAAIWELRKGLGTIQWHGFTSNYDRWTQVLMAIRITTNLIHSSDSNRFGVEKNVSELSEMLETWDLPPKMVLWRKPWPTLGDQPILGTGLCLWNCQGRISISCLDVIPGSTLVEAFCNRFLLDRGESTARHAIFLIA